MTDTNTAAEVKPYFQNTFSLAEFARRRAAVARAIGSGVAVLQGMPATGAFDLFRQHNDFFYLCGVETPHAYLTINGKTGRSVLYLLPLDPVLLEKEGAELNADDALTATRFTGVDDVRPLRALAVDLAAFSEIYVSHQPPEGRQACQDTLRHAYHQAERDPWRPAHSSFRQVVARMCGSAIIRDLSPILASLRLIKTPAELDVMRRAGKLTAMAVCEAMRSTEVGLLEDQLAAVADFIFRINGASGGGYRPIVACGDNSRNMHYYRNNCRLEPGRLVLMDYAPDCSCYTSDIGRMWPVSGSYEPWQQELYGFVVDYHQTLLELIAPGKTCAEICHKAADRLLPVVDRTRWTKPAFAEAGRTLLLSDKQFTHTVGMAVHDGGQYKDQPLQPGVVFALDPQLWVPGDQLYIRVEDTVAVTETGVENLTANCPHELEAVERLMCEPGIIQLRPDLMLH